MKVILGPYKRTIFNRIARFLSRGSLGDSRPVIKVMNYAYDADVVYRRFLEKHFPKWLEPREKVIIHDHDVYDLDRTLATIIAPSLRKLKEVKKGCPNVDIEDVPPDIAELSLEERWEWLIDEMIYVFDRIATAEYPPGNVETREHQSKVLILFGKYYHSLWD